MINPTNLNTVWRPALRNVFAPSSFSRLVFTSLTFGGKITVLKKKSYLLNKHLPDTISEIKVKLTSISVLILYQLEHNRNS